MFRLFRKNYLYSETIEPHCAYCSHCTKDNEHQGTCDLRGIVALAGHCKKFQYNPLMRVPPKPARIRGRFSDEDFFFEERRPDDEEESSEEPADLPSDAEETPDETMPEPTEETAESEDETDRADDAEETD